MKKYLVSLFTVFTALCLVGVSPSSAIINSWQKVLTGPINGVALTPSQTPGAPVVIFASATGVSAGIKRSFDGGATWEAVTTAVVGYITADPNAAGVLYSVATATGLSKSTDYGLTWTVLDPARKYWVAVSPFDSQVIFADNFKSTDGGATWTAMTGLPTFGSATNPPHIKCSKDPARPNFLLASAGERAYRSYDNGASWTVFDTSGIDTVEIDPVDARFYYLGTDCPAHPTRYFPQGTATASQRMPTIDEDAHGFAIDPTNHLRVFAVDALGTYTSNNGGVSWKKGTQPFGLVPVGRMTFDGDTGRVFLPVSSGYNSGLWVKHSWCQDDDLDGYSPTGGVCGQVDCDDTAAAWHPGVVENCFDGIDNACGGIDFANPWCVSTCVDSDSDGHYPLVCGGDDPDNNDVTVYPGAFEFCDDKDNNVDGTVDEGCTRYTYYMDYDTDGFGNPDGTALSSFTTPPEGYLTDTQDCDDYNAETHPGAVDVCGDAVDNDCNGTVDDGCPTFTYYTDADGDGYGDLSQPLVSTMTVVPWGASADSLDCNDQAGWINPAVAEDCDWVDNNCDGIVDEVCLHTAMVWGDNAKGQLGNGTTTDRKSPVALAGFSPIAIAAGNQHTLVVSNDSTVWAWGNNGSGQLGDGTTTTRKSPVKVSGLSGVIKVSAGLNHSLALKSDGTVWAWGGNGYGQLGDGTTTTRKTPVRVSGLTGVIAVSAGSSHNLALTNEGLVWAWGNNGSGRLGDGTAITRKIPVEILSYITAIAAGGEFSLALNGSGTVMAWGDNCKGQLGDGTNTTRKYPLAVSGLWAWAIAAGSSHSLAIGDGVLAWGDNAKGQLGDGTTTMRKVPVVVLDGAQMIAAGGSHSLASGWSGGADAVLAWGNNSDGQLGDGTTTTRKTPVVVPGQGDALFFAAGGAHSITLR